MLFRTDRTSSYSAFDNFSRELYFLNKFSAIGMVTSSLLCADNIVAINVCQASGHESPASLLDELPNFFSAFLNICIKYFFLSILFGYSQPVYFNFVLRLNSVENTALLRLADVLG